MQIAPPEPFGVNTEFKSVLEQRVSKEAYSVAIDGSDAIDIPRAIRMTARR